MDGIVKRVAVAVLVLGVLGVAACGDEEPAPFVIEVPEWARVVPEQEVEPELRGLFARRAGRDTGQRRISQREGASRTSYAMERDSYVCVLRLVISTHRSTGVPGRSVSASLAAYLPPVEDGSPPSALGHSRTMHEADL